MTHCEILGASFTLRGLQLISPINGNFSDSHMLRRIILKFKVDIYIKRGDLKEIKSN